MPSWQELSTPPTHYPVPQGLRAEAEGALPGGPTRGHSYLAASAETPSASQGLRTYSLKATHTPPPCPDVTEMGNTIQKESHSLQDSSRRRLRTPGTVLWPRTSW